MAKQAGDKSDKIQEEVEVKKYNGPALHIPGQDPVMMPQETLIVNPFNDSIPDDQKAVVDFRYEFGEEYFADVRFQGAVIYTTGKARHKHMTYQIAVAQRDWSKGGLFRACWMLDPTQMRGNDMQEAVQDMIHTIQAQPGGLILQVRDIIRSAIQKSRIDGTTKTLGRQRTDKDELVEMLLMKDDQESPWYIYRRTKVTIDMGGGSGSKKKSGWDRIKGMFGKGGT